MRQCQGVHKARICFLIYDLLLRGSYGFFETFLSLNNSSVLNYTLFVDQYCRIDSEKGIFTLVIEQMFSFFM